MKGCDNCKHYNGGLGCKAYPGGIPWPILSGAVAHDKPLPGDHGIQYEKKEGDNEQEDES